MAGDSPVGRRRSNVLNLFGIGGMLPWWATVLLALGTYALLHQYAVSDPGVAADPEAAPGTGLPSALRHVAVYAQYIVPWVLIVGMLTSVMRRAARRQLFSSVSARKGARDLDGPSWTPFEDLAHEQGAPPEEPTEPACPRCKGRMVRRTAKQGPSAGNHFWGCSRFPACHGTREMEAEERHPVSV